MITRYCAHVNNLCYAYAVSAEKDLRTYPIPQANALNFTTYERLAEQATFFRNDPNRQQQIATVRRYFLEETVEAIGEIEPSSSKLVPVLWGLPTDPPEDAASVKAEVRKELGDLLYMIKAGALIHGKDLGVLALRGVQHFTGQIPTRPILTFREFDAYIQGRMPDSVEPGYTPDYVGRQMFQTSPYLIDDEPYQLRLIELRDRVTDYARAIPANTAVDPELLKQTVLKIATLNHDPRYKIPSNPAHTLIADGLYALWLARTVAIPSPYPAVEATDVLSKADTFSEAASEALGVLSAVAQHRLDTTLAGVVQGNLLKIQRRAINNTLRVGFDSDRSKAVSDPRDNYTEWDVTCAGLFGSRPV